MKLFYVSLSLVAAITALSITGCGKSQDNGTNNGVVAAGAVVPPPAAVGTIPTGCYYNNYNGYNGYNGYPNNGYPNTGYNNTGCVGGSPCPSGYTVSGNTCVMNTVGNTNCPTGTWNGYSCQPSGFQCPAGTTFSYQYGGCLWVGNGSAPNYQGYQYSPYSYGYVYYYTGTQTNYQGYGCYYYFNGYSWTRRGC